MIEKNIRLVIAVTIITAIILLVITSLYFYLLFFFTLISAVFPNKYNIVDMILNVMYILAFIVMLIGIFVFHV